MKNAHVNETRMSSNGVGSGKMSMKTGVRDSEGLFVLEEGIIGEPMDEEEDEWSLVEESPDK
jgi:hypothetical protein